MLGVTVDLTTKLQESVRCRLGSGSIAGKPHVLGLDEPQVVDELLPRLASHEEAGDLAGVHVVLVLRLGDVGHSYRIPGMQKYRADGGIVLLSPTRLVFHRSTPNGRSERRAKRVRSSARLDIRWVRSGDIG